MGRSRRRTRLRAAVLWLAVARIVLSVAVIPFAPALYRRHFAVLVLLRPTKEVLLAGGFLVRRGDVGMVALTAAAVPLLLVGVWHFYALGRLYAADIRGNKLPGPAARLLPRRRIDALGKALDRRGTTLVVMGRLAAFPSTAVAAAAGTSGMPARTFLTADGVGGLLSFVEVVGAGYALGEAYERAGPWLTVAGVVVLAAAAIVLGQVLRRG